MRLLPQLTLFIALTTFLGACAPGSPSPDLPKPVVLALPADLEKIEYPLDAYRNEAERSGLIEWAWNKAVQHCLTRFGFDIAIGLQQPEPPRSAESRYGMVNAEKAATHGYTGAPIAEPQPMTLSERIPAQAVAIFDGSASGEHNGEPVPQGGCRAEAARQIIPTANPYFAQELEKTAGQRAAKDERLLGYVQKWSDCMALAGFRYHFPSEPYQAWIGRAQPGKVPAPEEIATAVADVKCKVDTDFLRNWVAIEVAYQHQIIEEKSAALADHVKAMTLAGQRAAAVAAEANAGG